MIKGIFLLVKNSLIFILFSSNISKSTTSTNAIKAEKDQNEDYSLVGKFAIYKNPFNYKTNFDSLDTLKLFKIPFLRKRCKGHTDQSIGKKKRQWKTLRQSNVNYGEKQQQQPVFQGILPKNIISRAHVKKYVKHDH